MPTVTDESLIPLLYAIARSVVVAPIETGPEYNVPLVDVRTLDDLNARQVLLRRYLVLTPAAFEALEQRFAKKES